MLDLLYKIMRLIIAGLLILPMFGIQSVPAEAANLPSELDNSRETETCINLRGCGRRDRT